VVDTANETVICTPSVCNNLQIGAAGGQKCSIDCSTAFVLRSGKDEIQIFRDLPGVADDNTDSVRTVDNSVSHIRWEGRFQVFRELRMAQHDIDVHGSPPSHYG
jgi:hypothetical protein